MNRKIVALVAAAFLCVAMTLLANTSASALDKPDPGPTTGLCTDPDGCDGQGPGDSGDPGDSDDPGDDEGYPGDSDPAGDTVDKSELVNNGFSCGYGSSNGAPWTLNQTQYGCWKGPIVYVCVSTSHWYNPFSWGDMACTRR
jgi:hypothetical protein